MARRRRPRMTSEQSGYAHARAPSVEALDLQPALNQWQRRLNALLRGYVAVPDRVSPANGPATVGSRLQGEQKRLYHQKTHPS
jgi:hypothetical protein